MRKLFERELAWTAQKHAALVPASAREATKIWTWPEPPNGAGAGETRAPAVGMLFTWDGNVVAEEAPLRLDGSTDSGNGTRWHYEPESFRPLAKQTPGGRLLSIANDHLGTPREMFDEAGNLHWAASSTTWGVVRGVKAPHDPANDKGEAIYRRSGTRGNLALKPTPDELAYDCPIRLQGQWADEESCLYYNRNRHFDPSLSQYLSPDPSRLSGGDRLFGYVQNPTLQIDPFGLRAFTSSDPYVADLANAIEKIPGLGRRCQS